MRVTHHLLRHITLHITVDCNRVELPVVSIGGYFTVRCLVCSAKRWEGSSTTSTYPFAPGAIGPREKEGFAQPHCECTSTTETFLSLMFVHSNLTVTGPPSYRTVSISMTGESNLRIRGLPCPEAFVQARRHIRDNIKVRHCTCGKCPVLKKFTTKRKLLCILKSIGQRIGFKGKPKLKGKCRDEVSASEA